MHIPTAWHILLSEIQGISPSAFIGGGALRDRLHNKPVKDIDIFFAQEDQAKLHETMLFAGWFPGQLIPMSYVGADYSVETACEYSKPGETPINLIGLNVSLELPDALSRFDFGICQIAYDGTHIHTSEQFYDDILTSSFTVTRCESEEQLARTMRRWERLKVKYPEHTLVIPEHCRVFMP
jgi:hypothetical protein